MSESELFFNTSFPPCDYSEWRPTRVIIPTVYLLSFALGSLGNGLVLWVFLRCTSKGRLRSCLSPVAGIPSGTRSSSASVSRSVTDSLIASLAVADLSFVLTLPLWAVYTALDYDWPFGRPVCRISSYLVALNMYASVFSLTGLSAERYWIIVRRGRGTLQAQWVVGSVWIVAAILALPALLLRTVREVDVETGLEPDWRAEGEAGDVHRSVRLCETDYSWLVSASLDPDEREHAELVWSAVLGLKSTLLGFLLPLAVLLLCYCSLGRLLASHFRQGPRPDRHCHRRLLHVIISLVLAFFLCWMPFHTNKTLSALVELGFLPYSCAFDRLLLVAHPYVTCLAYVNSCLNPLLYACCDAAFRRRCRSLLASLWCVNSGKASEGEKDKGSRSSVRGSGTREETSYEEEGTHGGQQDKG